MHIKQERHFRKAFKEANQAVEDGLANSNDFLEIIKNVLEIKYNDDDKPADEEK